MAIVWAKQAGSWSTASIWAFWNETTQQIEDYGQVPQSNDVVYCNGYTISFTNTMHTCKEIHNGINPYTNNTGGYLNGAGGASCIFNCDFYCERDSNYIIEGLNNWLYVNGNIYIQNNAAFCRTLNSGSYELWVNINGNITAPTSSVTLMVGASVRSTNVTINGNVYAPNMTLVSASQAQPRSCTITGNIDIKLLQPQNTSQWGQFYVYGYLQVYAYDNTPVYVNHIKYINFYLRLSNITALTANGVNYEYVGIEPNPNSYIIVNPVTIAQTYPPENKVLSPTQYGAQMELVGTYTPDYPPESVVLKDYEYGDSDDRKTGTMVQEVNVEVGCVTPEDVRKDVPLVGMGVVGSLVVPSADDVREGVVFDNGSVGTLIVQGGGDRLRIADFGYYTNAQSDTYIVDLTEQDKPKFAVAEERVLIEMFPDLDLDNIPDKYFDALFVKYLKYRLIVEYYRTAGINSTFTPSEPTTEIVNYQNVRNEVWLNSANIYLKAWGKKYPESIVKPQRILL